MLFEELGPLADDLENCKPSGCTSTILRNENPKGFEEVFWPACPEICRSLTTLLTIFPGVSRLVVAKASGVAVWLLGLDAFFGGAVVDVDVAVSASMLMAERAEARGSVVLAGCTCAVTAG